MNNMRVLSLFDGISCGQVALERAGFKPSVYLASEIDKEAIKVTQSNYPKTIQLGGVQGVTDMARAGVLGDIDLLIGGSPCQGFSTAGKGLGFADPRSQLLFNYISVKAAVKPKYFLLENVRMKKDDQDFVSALIGCEPVEIDSALFSAQRRKRMYWTNIPIAPIVDRGIKLADILGTPNYKLHQKKNPYEPRRDQTKAGTLTGASGHAAGNHSDMDVLVFNDAEIPTTSTGRINIHETPDVRRYRIVECEMLQTVPLGYTNAVSQSAAYRALANGWTVDVIAHILSGMQQPVYMKQLARGFNKGFEKPVEKSPTVTAYSWQHNNFVSNNGQDWRKMSVNEVERLQTLPDNYTAVIAPPSAFKAIGNGWTVDVIAHILKGLQS